MPDLKDLIHQERCGGLSTWEASKQANKIAKAIKDLEYKPVPEQAQKILDITLKVIQKEKEAKQTLGLLVRSLQQKFNIDVSALAMELGIATNGERKYLREKERRDACNA